MKVRRVILSCVALWLASRSDITAQQGQTWTVRQEWVRAHEAFLASDALQGRGSATRDEEIAATYVASEFEAYGLKPAPGMNGYLQSAEVETPHLTGHATLSAGGLSLAEGTEFDLLSSTGGTVTGPLLRLNAKELVKAKPPAGSVVLLAGITDPRKQVGQVMAMAGRAGAAMLLLEGGGPLEGLYAKMGGGTRTMTSLVNGPANRLANTLVLLRAGALPQWKGIADVTTVTLAVAKVPQAKQATFNAIGYLPGSDPGAGTLLLTAHLDHLGVSKPVNGDAIYNGANDDAAGTTAVLELAHALASGPKLRRSVLFVCYGSEELVGLGSTYFGEHPPVPLKDLVANLEFEMVGNQDPKMPKGVLLLTGWERSNLGPALKEHGALLGPDPYPEEHFFERSDNYSLALKGVVAHTAAGWGTPPTYHQPNDDLLHLDIPFMTAAIQSLVEPVRWLAGSEFVPKWNPGGKP